MGGKQKTTAKAEVKAEVKAVKKSQRVYDKFVGSPLAEYGRHNTQRERTRNARPYRGRRLLPCL
jgi:hypothetical protein